jgi:hypothetical protein
MNRLHTALTAFAFLTAASSASAVTITVVNNDGPGEGFNDPTVVPALGSNPGTTLGAQRLHVFQTAANQWGALLNGTVEIKVRAAFNPLTCSGTSAVLGSAGAVSVHRDFANAPVAGTWYAASLANNLAGTDLGGTAVGQEEINSQFNVTIDAGTCLNGTAGWYYGTDPAVDAPPTDRVPLLPVVFHELGHGLGFQTFTNGSTGAFFNAFPDIWTNFLADAPSGTTWRNMANDAARAASAISDPNLVWTGPNVTADQGDFLGAAPNLIINAPASIAGSSVAQPAAFGPTVTAPGVTDDIVAALPADGCVALTNAAAIAGNFALIDRGTCNFTVKVANAQAAGATGVVIANNVATGLPGMGGADPTITIPSYGVLQSVGTAIRGALATQTVNVTLGFGTALSGTNGGFVRMHAPNPLAQGSSVSHFTVDAFPNLLMEPSLNSTIFDEVDLTLSLFRDIGWQATGGPLPDALFSNGFEP